LRQNPKTAGIPVIFMTARAQAREVDRFRSLGAVGVIQKPFDPMTLAASVRSYAQPAGNPLDDLRVGFLQRLRRDAAALSEERLALKDGNRSPDTLKRVISGISRTALRAPAAFTALQKSATRRPPSRKPSSPRSMISVLAKKPTARLIAWFPLLRAAEIPEV
jgi:CheY-like chemotaxis protein